jgi:TRAP-type uncharacterized transport system fused permease subunit
MIEALQPLIAAAAFLLESIVWVSLAVLIMMAVGIAPIHFEQITIICTQDHKEEVLKRYGIVLTSDQDELEDPEDPEDPEE